MNVSNLRVGIIHSLIGKNDGVSIIIDQTVHAMVNNMGISLGNIFFLGAHSSPRFNAKTDEVFWHKNELHNQIISTYSKEPATDLDVQIKEEASYAKEVLADWVEKNNIDLIIAHNTSHVYNFITAVALGFYFEELRAKSVVWPKLLVWWHDSHFERDVFKNPNTVIKKYLKYLPGTYVDGLVFINHGQIALGKKVFSEYNPDCVDQFFEERSEVVPNTSEITWDWKLQLNGNKNIIAPDVERYNRSFWKDAGILPAIEQRGFDMDTTEILLQHTRIVPRKKIEVAIDLAFRLEEKFLEKGMKRCFVVLVTGHSGDEQNEYKKWLLQYYDILADARPESNVLLFMSEDIILSHRDIIVDKKYYKFAELPAVAAADGAIGTYFSEVEGFGNNLLEMMSFGVPSLINRYETFVNEIEHMGFKLPAINDCEITDKLVEEAYRLLTDIPYRNSVVVHNMRLLEEHLGHHIIAQKITPLIENIFTKFLPCNGH